MFQWRVRRIFKECLYKSRSDPEYETHYLVRFAPSNPDTKNNFNGEWPLQLVFVTYEIYLFSLYLNNV
jgi:hypothetical protein